MQGLQWPLAIPLVNATQAKAPPIEWQGFPGVGFVVLGLFRRFNYLNKMKGRYIFYHAVYFQ